MRWIGDISVKSPLLQAPRRPWSSATWRCWWPSRYRSRSRWWCCCRWCRCCHLTLGGGIWWKCLGEFSNLSFFSEKNDEKSLKWLLTNQMLGRFPVNWFDFENWSVESSFSNQRNCMKDHESECSWSWPTKSVSVSVQKLDGLPKCLCSYQTIPSFSHKILPAKPRPMSPALWPRPDNCLRYGCPRVPWISRTSRSPTWLHRLNRCGIVSFLPCSLSLVSKFKWLLATEKLDSGWTG